MGKRGVLSRRRSLLGEDKPAFPLSINLALLKNEEKGETPHRRRRGGRNPSFFGGVQPLPIISTIRCCRQ